MNAFAPGDEPAFPQPVHEGAAGDLNFTSSPGLTIRDYFAAEAMRALIDVMGSRYMSPDERRGIAMESYNLAEAMLDERATFELAREAAAPAAPALDDDPGF